MNKEEVLKILDLFQVEQIPETRNYWLIRTASGKYFDDFLSNNYVSINWDDVGSIDYIKNAEEDELKKRVKTLFPKDEKPGYIAGQLKKFVNNIKTGDIVLIPSINSSRIAFGTVTSDAYFNDSNANTTNPTICPFKKRINVTWLKILNKNEFNSDLYRLMTAHITISNITKHQEQINRILYPLYFQEEKLHIIFNVKSTDNISLLELSSFLCATSKFAESFGNYSEIPVNSNEFNVKLNVQSPGPIEIIGNIYDFINNSSGAIIVLLLALAFIIGGKVNYSKTEKETKFSAESDGTFEKILKLKQENNKQKNIEAEYLLKQQQQEFEHLMKSLEISNPLLINSSNSLNNTDSNKTNKESNSINSESDSK